MKNKKNQTPEPEMRLDAIIEYEMDELEAKAYKLCLIWLERSRKVFPEYQHTRMKQGDPRKSLTWKLCYKLVRETQNDVLLEADYSLYVRAQLDVLKHIFNSTKTHPVIDANCLIGEKAWKRWKLWKRKYDSVAQKPTEVSKITHPGIAKALAGLEVTKEFFVKTFGTLTFDKFEESYTNKNIFRWINFGKISPYYLAVSPFIAKLIKPDEMKKLNFDLEVYKPCITEVVLAKFKELFPNENVSN